LSISILPSGEAILVSSTEQLAMVEADEARKTPVMIVFVSVYCLLRCHNSSGADINGLQ
jgi:hypothetical protein